MVATFGGDVLADEPVAARRRPHVATVLVQQRDREPVHLGLAHERDRVGDLALDPLAPRLQVVERERVVERLHRLEVRDLAERRRRRRAHLPGGRVGRRELGELPLEPLELAVQLVELGVGDLGLVELEVALAVVAHEPAQLVDAGFDLGRRRHDLLVALAGSGFCGNGRRSRRSRGEVTTATARWCSSVVSSRVVPSSAAAVPSSAGAAPWSAVRSAASWSAGMLVTTGRVVVVGALVVVLDEVVVVLAGGSSPPSSRVSAMAMRVTMAMTITAMIAMTIQRIGPESSSSSCGGTPLPPPAP